MKTGELREADRRLVARLVELLTAAATCTVEIDIRDGRISDFVERRHIRPGRDLAGGDERDSLAAL